MFVFNKKTINKIIGRKDVITHNMQREIIMIFATVVNEGDI